MVIKQKRGGAGKMITEMCLAAGLVAVFGLSVSLSANAAAPNGDPAKGKAIFMEKYALSWPAGKGRWSRGRGAQSEAEKFNRCKVRLYPYR